MNYLLPEELKNKIQECIYLAVHNVPFKTVNELFEELSKLEEEKEKE